MNVADSNILLPQRIIGSATAFSLEGLTFYMIYTIESGFSFLEFKILGEKITLNILDHKRNLLKEFIIEMNDFEKVYELLKEETGDY